MADNFPVTPGTGTSGSVATEDIAGNQYQKFKLASGTASSTAMIGGDATNGLDVDVTRSQQPEGATTCGDGRQTCAVAGTREQFGAQACKYVIITAEDNNTSEIVIGGVTVVAAASGGGTTRRGITLQPSQSIRLDISNLNLIYIDAVTSTDGVNYAYFS